MKKIVFSLLSLCFAISAHAGVEVRRSASQMIYNVNIEGLDFSDSKIRNTNFHEVQLKGIPDSYQGVLYNPGMPAVPVIRIYVPGFFDVKFNPSTAQILDAPVQKSFLQPVVRSNVKLPGIREAFTMNQAAYNSEQLYPNKAYTAEYAGSYHGQSYKLVTIYPLAYNAKQNRYILRSNFTITTSMPRTAGNPKVMAFVVGAQFANSPSLQKYMDFKKSQGFQIAKITIGQEANNPEDIRGQLQKIYQQTRGGLGAALLVGDAADVPGKKSSIIRGTTDHYYRAIDTSNYATDINGPDIAVGRFPAATEAQLQVMVEKSIAYQTGRFGRTDWLNKATWLATHDRYQVAEGTHNYAIQNYAAKAGYQGVFPAGNAAGGDKLYPITLKASRAQIISAMASGRSWIQYSGHGSEGGWEDMSQNDFSQFKSDALPFVVSNSCLTGNFLVDESFAETWLRQPHGAVFYWGSMDLTYWDEDDILEKAQVDGIYKGGLRSFADITSYALSEVWRHYGGADRSAYYWETYHSFGDPTIQFRVLTGNRRY